MEDTAREFEEVGQAVRAVLAPFGGGPVRKKPKRDTARRKDAAAAAAEQNGNGAAPIAGDSESRRHAKEMSDELATAVRMHSCTTKAHSTLLACAQDA
jgi:hypothetical protein